MYGGAAEPARLVAFPALSLFSVILAVVILASVLGGCAGTINRADLTASDAIRHVTCRDAPCHGSLDVQFLGTAGFKITHGDDVVLLSPFFSHVSFGQMLFGSIASDIETVRMGDRRFALGKADAIVVGHGHYDHLLDVPTIANNFAISARIYGNDTVCNRLYPTLVADRHRCRELTSHAWPIASNPEEIPLDGTDIRMLAVRSAHAPHLCGRRLGHCLLAVPDGQPPRTSWDWCDGDTLAFLFRFPANDAGGRDLTVLYFDSASGAEVGRLPPGTPPVDVLIVSVALFENVERHPEAVIEQTRPRHVILGHWNNFFRSYVEEYERPEPAPNTDVVEFVKRMKLALPVDSSWTLPAPGATVRYGDEIAPGAFN